MQKGFYEHNQNNSGGSFDVDDKVCHIVVIEANSADEAKTIAISLGIYFDGCSEGVDCNCCGDRWYEVDKPFNLAEINDGGYGVSKYGEIEDKTEAENSWYTDYGVYEVVKKPEWIPGNRLDSFEGLVKFHSLEEYLQYIVNGREGMFEGHMARIYHLNGSIKEIRSTK